MNETAPHATATAQHTRRSALFALAVTCGALEMSPAYSQVQAFPTRPIRLVVGYPAGGTADQLARAAAEGAQRALGQPIVVENRPGANGNLAADLVARSAADGYTLLVTAPGPLAVNGALYASLPFDPKTAFAPVTRLAAAPLLLVVDASLPVKNLQELLAYLKANPGRASFGSQGNASSGHLAMELLKQRTGLQATHVPYKGSAPALNDLLAGHIAFMFDNTTTSLPHVREGSLRAIAVAEAQRIEAIREVPTVAESGVPGFAATPWFGIVAPAGTAKPVVDRLNTVIRAAIQSPAVKSRFAQLGVAVVTDTPEEFATYIASETQKWAEVVRVSGAKAD
jgi:tripartite-type tricarboxylate transporter receptor subunit TctC